MSEKSSDNFKYNKHLVHIITGIANQHQVIKALEMAISNAGSTLCKIKNLNQKYIVNVVKTANNFYPGDTYVWCHDPRLAAMLACLNPDGSHRVEIVDDPKWICPERPKEKKSQKEIESTSGGWGDMMEELDQYFNEDRYFCPKIKRDKESLIPIPTVTLSDDQKRKIVIGKIKNLIENGELPPDYELGDSLDETNVTEDMLNPLDQISLIPSIAWKTEPRYSVHRNELRSNKPAPSWITANMIKAKIVIYASDSVTKVARIVKGKKHVDTYPMVSFDEKRHVYIVFDPKNDDCLFARYMIRKMLIEHNGFSSILEFNFKNRTEYRS